MVRILYSFKYKAEKSKYDPEARAQKSSRLRVNFLEVVSTWFNLHKVTSGLIIQERAVCESTFPCWPLAQSRHKENMIEIHSAHDYRQC